MTKQNSDRPDPAKTNKLTEGDFADDKMGKNSLQGHDQEQVRNQRHAVPGEKREAEDLIESFENADPRVRAGRQNSGRSG